METLVPTGGVGDLEAVFVTAAPGDIRDMRVLAQREDALLLQVGGGGEVPAQCHVITMTNVYAQCLVIMMTNVYAQCHVILIIIIFKHNAMCIL